MHRINISLGILFTLVATACFAQYEHNYKIRKISSPNSVAMIGRFESMFDTEAETADTESVTRINEFLTGKWAAYRKMAESTPVKLFKD